MNRVTWCAPVLLSVLMSMAADARITRVEITRVESPTFQGTSFGTTGQYEKLVGKALLRDFVYSGFSRDEENRKTFDDVLNWIAGGDPRPSLAERYSSNEAYVQQVRDAAQNLLRQRLMLQEDVDRAISAAQGSDIGK